MSKPSSRSREFVSAPLFETLEDRLLLTTLFGGDVFEFLAPGGTVRITLEGDVIAELIGADIALGSFIDDHGNFVARNTEILGDVPGMFISSDLGRDTGYRIGGAEFGRYLGGLGGRDGVQLIGQTPITGSPNDWDFPWNIEGMEEINIQGIGTNAAGETRGFNVAEVAVPDGDGLGGTVQDFIFQYLDIDTTDGTATVIEEHNLYFELADPAGGGVAVVAGDFLDDTYYFVMQFEADDAKTDKLYSIPLNGGVPTEIITLGDTPDNEITSIAWEETLAGDRLIASRVNTLWVEDRGQIISINPDAAWSTTVLASDLTYLDEDGEIERITDISGIEFINDDPSAEDDIYAVQAGATGEILRIDRSDWSVRFLGPLSDQDVDPEAIQPRGQDLQGLSWDPVANNPFTNDGEVGVLIATDATTDELVYVDHRARTVQPFPGEQSADAFCLYVIQSSENASISMASITEFDPEDPNPDEPRAIEVFTGSIDQLNIETDAQGATSGGVFPLDAPNDSGKVYIGARTEPLDDNVEDEEDRPIIWGNLGRELGVRAQNVDDLPGDPDNDVSAGVQIAESLLTYVSQHSSLANRLLGENLDIISAMATARDGSIVVVDSDGVNDAGDFISADQITTVSGATGLATATPTTITRLGSDVSGILAMAYGDPDGDDTETLYAVLDVAGTLKLGTLDVGLSLFTDVVD
ncbi:MAG: hypothetical protein ACYSTL_03145, partial [Planctomycetota bacterium]